MSGAGPGEWRRPQGGVYQFVTAAEADTRPLLRSGTHMARVRIWQDGNNEAVGQTSGVTKWTGPAGPFGTGGRAGRDGRAPAGAAIGPGGRRPGRAGAGGGGDRAGRTPAGAAGAGDGDGDGGDRAGRTPAGAGGRRRRRGRAGRTPAGRGAGVFWARLVTLGVSDGQIARSCTPRSFWYAQKLRLRLAGRWIGGRHGRAVGVGAGSKPDHWWLWVLWPGADGHGHDTHRHFRANQAHMYQ